MFHPIAAGAQLQNTVEKRSDVLIFTSDPLPNDVEVVGRAYVDLWVRTRGALSSDFVARLCDVRPDGTSFNVCDGVQRVNLESTSGGAGKEGTEGGGGSSSDGAGGRGVVPGDAGKGVQGVVHRVRVDLSATAKRFKAGHRIRLQVCGGSHPRWIRNCGGKGSGDVVTDYDVDDIKLFRSHHDILHEQHDVVGVDMGNGGGAAGGTGRQRARVSVLHLPILSVDGEGPLDLPDPGKFTKEYMDRGKSLPSSGSLVDMSSASGMSMGRSQSMNRIADSVVRAFSNHDLLGMA